MGFVEEIKKFVRGDDIDGEYEGEYAEDGYEDNSSDFQDRRPDSSTAMTSSRQEKIVNIHATTQLSVVLVKPEKFENAAEIADHLKDKRTVVLNLENTNKEVSRRLVDFLSGVAYANEGKIKKIANSTYIITPYNVDLLGDLIDELETSGLYL